MGATMGTGNVADDDRESLVFADEGPTPAELAEADEPAEQTEPARFRVTFDRVGRHHQVPALDVTAWDADDVAEQVHRYARRYLASRDVEVVVDLSAGNGTIFCGVQVGGSFTVAEVAEVAAS